MVLYDSTRGGNEGIASAEAIKKGISPNGGLYVPRDFEKLTIDEIVTLKDMTYQERAVTVLKRFLDDFTIDELKDCVSKAYNNKNSPVLTLCR